MDARPPDLILLDVRVPAAECPAFLSEYHATPGRHAPVVLMTTSPATMEDAARVGAAALIPKPFDLDALLAVVACHTGFEERPPPR